MNPRNWRKPFKTKRRRCSNWMQAHHKNRRATIMASSSNVSESGKELRKESAPSYGASWHS